MIDLSAGMKGPSVTEQLTKSEIIFLWNFRSQKLILPSAEYKQFYHVSTVVFVQAYSLCLKP